MKKYTKTNSEMVSIDARLGRIEGRLDEGFDNIKSDINEIFKKINALPCQTNSQRISRNEAKINGMIKGAYFVIASVITLVSAILNKIGHLFK